MIPIIYVLLSFVILIGLYLIAICPRGARKSDFTSFECRFYAHRGLHDNNSFKRPENSLPAFEAAIAKGLGIELDVQITKDGIPVVFHDATLKRMCGKEKTVSECTYEELSQFPLLQSQEHIPKLEAVMSMIAGRVPVIVEIKMYDKNIEVNELAMQVLDHYLGVYCMESFHPKALRWFKKNRPNVLRGQLSANFIRGKEPGNKFKYFCWQNLLWNFLTKPDFIAYNYQEKNMLSVVLCRKLYKVTMFAWTIRSKEGYQAAKDSFDYFIYDTVDITTLKNC